MNEWWLKDYGDLDEIEQRIINWIKSHPDIFIPIETLNRINPSKNSIVLSTFKSSIELKQ